MTPRGGRASRRRASSSLLVVGAGAVAAACNMLTGAGDLAPCEGATCESMALTPDGSVTNEDGSVLDDGSLDRAPTFGGDGALADASASETGPEGGATCPLCDGGACCAPNTCVIATGICGACSTANGPCQVDSDCCSGLVCNTRGACVASCRAKGPECSVGSCCLGTRCSLLTGVVCTACGLHGASCTNNAGCCSTSCVNNACVGSVSSGPGGG